MEVGTKEICALIATDSLRVGVGSEIIDELHDILIRMRAMVERAINILDGNYGFDGIGPIDGLAIDDTAGIEKGVLPVIPVHVCPIDRGADGFAQVGGTEVINLRHDIIAPVAEFLEGKSIVETDDGKGRVGEKLVGPMRADGGAELPGFGRTIGADPGLITLPFGFGIENKTVGALVENIIGNGNFTDDIGAVGTVVAKDQHSFLMGDVAKASVELGEVVAAVEQLVVAGGFDDDVTDALAFEILHEADLIGNG